MNKNYQKRLLIIVIIIMLVILVGATFAYLSVNITKVGSESVEIETNGIDIFEIKNIKEANLNANSDNFGPDNGENQTDDAEMAVTLETSKDSASYCYEVNVLLPPQLRNQFEKQISTYLTDNLNSPKTKDDLINELDNNVCNFTNNYTLSSELKDILCTIDSTNFNSTICNSNQITITSENINAIKDSYCNSVFSYNTENNTPEFVISVYKSVNNGSYKKVIDNMDITDMTGILKVPTSLNSSNYKNTITATNGNKQIENWKAEVTLVWLEEQFQDNMKGKNYQAYLEINKIDC